MYLQDVSYVNLIDFEVKEYSFKVLPSLGSHRPSPQQLPLYFNGNAMLHVVIQITYSTRSLVCEGSLARYTYSLTDTSSYNK